MKLFQRGFGMRNLRFYTAQGNVLAARIVDTKYFHHALKLGRVASHRARAVRFDQPDCFRGITSLGISAAQGLRLSTGAWSINALETSIAGLPIPRTTA
jgi:hypothetical protein